MHRFLLFILLPCLAVKAESQNLNTVFEKSGGKESPAYNEIISWWKNLDAVSPLVKMHEMGPSDAGFPIHLVVISSDKTFNIKTIKSQKKAIILFNNGIHPGEPDGINASMLLAEEIVKGKYKLPSNVVLALIPVYNIGGCLNRSKFYRIDQNGPVEKGFRGNAQNLDLNRDFIKCDSKNAFTFTHIFHYLDPDVFADNHVSNGADYQHVMTLLTSQHNKMGPVLGNYMENKFEPALFQLMKQKGWDMVPYVNHFGESVKNGWSAFWDSPRYSSGFTSLWNTLSFTPETHMLKPYKQRVESTRDLEKAIIEYTSSHANEIIELRKEAFARQRSQTTFPIAWKLDRSKSKEITFKGYESGYKPSDIAGQPRLYYDRSQPYTKQIPFYNIYTDTLSINKPKAYLIPQGWWKVIERLQTNNIRMKRLGKDTSLEIEWYRIESYQSSPRPYEGHHPNSNVRITIARKKMNFRKGDYYIPVDQDANRFIIETLEPQAEDSYFTWNFFDSILGQKEGYSDYAFEDIASAYLKTNTDLKNNLNNKIKSDTAFAKNGPAQLNYVYLNSPYFEPAYLQYPVYRVMQ